MSYGISPAPECFQQKLDQNLQGLPGVYRIADDLLITGQGDTKEEADKDSSIGNGGIGTKCAETTTRKKCAKIPRSNISGMPRSNAKVKCQGQISQGQMGNRKKPEKWESVTKIKKP